MQRDANDIADEEAEEEDERASGESHVLWNVVGGSDQEVVPEVYRTELQLGDLVLLCTDGQTKHVRRTRLANMLSSDQSVEEICHQLVDEANDQGGSDNITVVLSRFRETVVRTSGEAHIELPLDEKPDPFADTWPEGQRLNSKSK